MIDRDHSRLGADCRDSPPEGGTGEGGADGIQVAGPRRASEEEVATGAFLGIGLQAKTAAPPSPPALLLPWLLQDGRSTPLSRAGVSPTTGRGPKPCPLGWHRLFPVSRDHFAVQAPSASFSTDGTILTPSRAGCMTTVPADHFPRL